MIKGLKYKKAVRDKLEKDPELVDRIGEILQLDYLSVIELFRDESRHDTIAILDVAKIIAKRFEMRVTELFKKKKLPKVKFDLEPLENVTIY